MNTHPNSKTRWLALVIGGLVLIALAGQVVSAQPPNSDLKPPFQFAEQPARPDAQPLPPGSTLLMTENFGGSFNPVTTLTGSTPQWRTIVNPGDGAGYAWDRTDKNVTPPPAFANSAWSAARLFTATQVLTPGVSTYPAGQDAWLIYGPINLSKFTYAHVSFEYYLDSQAGDTLLWGFSTDGQTFNGNMQSGLPGDWITNTFSFPTNASSQSVYLAFAFDSQTTPQGLGAFVRSVRLTAEPLKYVYAPLIMNNYPPTPTPTPTPLPLYGPYTFDVGTTDIDRFGGTYNGVGSGGGGQYGYGQFVRTNPPHGNPGKSLTLYNGAYWVMTASSPNTDQLPGDFELSVDMSPWVIYPKADCGMSCDGSNLGNMYGVIFNASANTFGSNPSQFNFNGQFYMAFFYTIDATKPIGVKLRRCSGGNCVTLRTNESLPPGLLYGNAAYWDKFIIKRVGANIDISLNGVSIININDASFLNGRYGMFIFPSDGNYPAFPVDLGYAMQVDFDNIKVENLP
jgi:hypothetical protein